MAKKSGEFSFNDLNSLMNKQSKWGGLMSEGAGVSEITEYIPTGNYILNAAFTGSVFQGIPGNRSIEIFGPSGTGKTYIMLNIAREAQKMGYYIIWYDSENAIESSQVKKFGCDVTKFRYEPVQTVQEFRSSVTYLVDALIEQKEAGNTIPKLMVILDSAGNLATQKEIDDAKAGQEKQDMTRPKVMKSIFRIIMSKMGVIGASFIFSNHCYSTMDLFSQQVAAGGCLIPGSLIRMADGNLKVIEDIVVGDMVETLDGPKMIDAIWRFEKPTITVEFEDGSKLECSRTHRFFIGDDVSEIFNDDAWVESQNLKEGMEVKQCAQLKTLKVKKVTENSSTKVCDLTVRDVQHYITDNGVINHNTGAEYGASVILLVNKAKLKEGTNQVGIIVNAKPTKNRFCKPVVVKFHIDYTKGLNPYVGLDEYYSWERCGVGRGKFITEKEYEKSPNEDYCRVEKPDGEVVYFAPSDSGRNICCDDGSIFPLGKIFTKEVWTQDRLERLDKYIQSEFKYADGVQVGELFEGDEENDEPDGEVDVEDMIKSQMD